jgi:MoaA/NifB/PqqE/SkfB family radical SAM enzyme
LSTPTTTPTTTPTRLAGRELVAARFLTHHLIVRQGSERGLTVPAAHYRALESAPPDKPPPGWLVDAAREAWGVDVADDLADRPTRPTILFRDPSPYGYGRASYELNLGCNYDCEHCYLGLKRFEGLAWPDRKRLLHLLADAGVVWLQLTGGEPLIDRLFLPTYQLAWQLGMMITISSNGSRLANPDILHTLTTHRPYRITLSVYGATADAYDSLTRRPGSYRKFMKGLTAAHHAGLPLRLNLVLTRHNAHEADAMAAIADGLGIPHHSYSNISPTIYGGAEALPSQSTEYLKKRKPFTGCNAGHTFFHVDPHGRASICKIGREPNVPLVEEGITSLARLGHIADGLLTRQGGCSGCTLSGSCGTCMPLAALYRKAGADKTAYCQHR